MKNGEPGGAGDRPRADRGVIYCATRRPAYRQLAANSARSLRKFMPDVDITLFTDAADLGELGGVFDGFRMVRTASADDRRWASGLLDKIAAIGASPYERSLFIDADTVIRRPEITGIFDFLDDADLALVPCAPEDSLSCRLYGPIFNTGVIAFKRSEEMDRLLSAWLSTTLRNVEAAYGDDLGVVQGLPKDVAERDAKFLAVTDQFSLAQFISPAINRTDLKIRMLDGNWNWRLPYAGGENNPIIIDADPAIRERAFAEESASATPPDGAAAHDLKPVFATYTQLRPLTQAHRLNDALISFIRENVDNAKVRNKAGVGGKRTHGNIFEQSHPAIRALHGLLTTACADFLRDYLPRNFAPVPFSIDMKLTGWAYILGPGAYIDSHVHSAGMISGTYYVQMPQSDADSGRDGGAIVLSHPSRAAVMNAGPFVAVDRYAPPIQAGDLLLFPSHIEHRVLPFAGSGERIAVSFDVTLERAR